MYNNYVQTIWVFNGRNCNLVGNAVPRLIGPFSIQRNDDSADKLKIRHNNLPW